MVLRRLCQTLLFSQYLLLLVDLWFTGERIFCLLRFGADVPGSCLVTPQPWYAVLLAFLGLGVYSVSGLFTGHRWARRPYAWYAGLQILYVLTFSLRDLGRQETGPRAAEILFFDYLPLATAASVLLVLVGVYVRPSCFEATETN